jgi:hypothetical protein
MITDKDITKLKKVFVTKEDSKKFATKDDLKRFATKDDLKRFATKEDLEHSEQKTALGFADTQRQINELKSDVAQIKDHLISMEDNILGAINNLQNENKLVSTYLPKVNNHETRITKLESSVFPSH